MYSIQEDSRGIFFYTLIKAKNLLEEKKKKTHCHYNELKNQIINQPPQLDKIICQNQLLTISIVSISETKHNITTPKTITLKQNTGPFQINSRKIPKLYNSINQFDWKNKRERR